MPLQVGKPESVKVDAVIGADGANSRVAKEIDAGDYDYAIAFQVGGSGFFVGSRRRGQRVPPGRAAGGVQRCAPCRSSRVACASQVSGGASFVMLAADRGTRLA